MKSLRAKTCRGVVQNLGTTYFEFLARASEIILINSVVQECTYFKPYTLFYR